MCRPLIVVEGGKFGEVSKVSANTGTVMTVEDLFYCVPARAKFLKKNKKILETLVMYVKTLYNIEENPIRSFASK